MSRIGKKTITLPKGVQVQAQGLEVSVTGPKGSLSRRLPAGVSVILDNGAVRLETGDDGRSGRAIWGLARTLVNNMVVGVSTGFRR
ncbi:MAG: 50S ribosomal protein L6, partial [Thermodesulfobacteriota bacterium]